MKFIDLRIECLEDIKVTSALNQSNNNESLSYISGSVIRGAFINNYIKLFNIKDINENEESKSWFFKNKLEFLNGYIESQGDRTYPIVQGLYTDATGINRYHSNLAVEVKSGLINKINETDKKFSPCEFITFENDGLIKGVGVNKVFNLHIRKGEDRQMFRYEAISKGQSFRSIIKANITAEEIQKVLDVLKNDDFYIGGSKGSGYGKVRITVIDILNKNPEAQSIKKEFENEFVVFTTSDGIFIDEYGNSISYIDEKWLEEKLEVKNIKLVSAVNEEILVGGYNKKWGIRLPQYLAVKKGSVLKYTFDGIIDTDKLELLQSEGYGLRTEEGYGRFIILSNLQISKVEKFNSSKGNERLGRVNYSEEEKEQMKFIVNSMVRKNIENKMKEIIVSNYSKEGKVNNNQIGKLVQLFSLAQKKTKEDGIKSIRDYIEHLSTTSCSKDGVKKERINQGALNQLKDLKIGGKNAKDFILNEINEFTLDNFKDQYSVDSIKIDRIKADIMEEEAYIYKMIELENTFRYILRRKEVK